MDILKQKSLYRIIQNNFVFSKAQTPIVFSPVLQNCLVSPVIQRCDAIVILLHYYSITSWFLAIKASIDR